MEKESCYRSEVPHCVLGLFMVKGLYHSAPVRGVKEADSFSRVFLDTLEIYCVDCSPSYSDIPNMPCAL